MSRRGRLRLALVVLGTLALVVAGGSSALAAPPANDDFDHATVIPGLPFSDSLDTTEATTAADDPFCAGNAHTVWYSFTPSSDVSVVANTFGSDYDTTVSAYTGTRGTLTQIACNDDSGDTLQSRIAFDAAAGVTYSLMVGSFDESDGGNLSFSVAVLPPPLQLGVTIAADGTVDRAGVATIHGTVSCSRPASVDLLGTLRQQAARGATVGTFALTVDCSSVASWSSPVVGETGTYKKGDAQATVAASVFDPDRGETVTTRASKTVRLQKM
jgi:hypothetical protein